MLSPRNPIRIFRKVYNYNDSIIAMSPSIKIENKGAVRVLTLNRPQAFNSFDREMGKAFQEALDDAAVDDSVRCIIITGEGRAFCAGQDLKEVTAPDAPDFKIIVEETYNASIRRICSMRKPIVAAVNGVAAGAGANIALACDLTIATESASFIQAFSKIGLIPDSGGTWSQSPQRYMCPRHHTHVKESYVTYQQLNFNTPRLV